MPITKRALLISNPGEHGAENYCKGVYADIKNYQRMLTSPIGGGWENSEIQHLDRPTAKNVREWLAIFSVIDYVLVMFTGHGWYSAPDRDRILELRKGEKIASNDLLVGTKKRTVVLDCCQKVHQESLLEKQARQVAFSANASLWRSPNRAACQKLFSDSVVAAPEGVLRLTSCAINEVSTDDDTRGGRYNGSLIECVEDWALAQAKKQFNVSPAVFSVVAAHECAAERTRKMSGGKQNPGIEKSKTTPYFPFAVFA
jgi:hypothetical protein